MARDKNPLNMDSRGLGRKVHSVKLRSRCCNPNKRRARAPR